MRFKYSAFDVGQIIYKFSYITLNSLNQIIIYIMSNKTCIHYIYFYKTKKGRIIKTKFPKGIISLFIISVIKLKPCKVFKSKNSVPLSTDNKQYILFHPAFEKENQIQQIINRSCINQHKWIFKPYTNIFSKTS